MCTFRYFATLEYSPVILLQQQISDMMLIHFVVLVSPLMRVSPCGVLTPAPPIDTTEHTNTHTIIIQVGPNQIEIIGQSECLMRMVYRVNLGNWMRQCESYTKMQIYQWLSKSNSVTLSECIKSTAKLANQFILSSSITVLKCVFPISFKQLKDISNSADVPGIVQAIRRSLLSSLKPSSYLKT